MSFQTRTAIPGELETASDYNTYVRDPLNALDAYNVAATKTASANPAGTSDGTGKMMGLAGSITTKTGRVQFAACGYFIGSTTPGTPKAQLRFGTGSAPANGDALAGTATGSLQFGAPDNNASALSLAAIELTLTPGVTYWYDLSLASTAGAVSIVNVTTFAVDIK